MQEEVAGSEEIVETRDNGGRVAGLVVDKWVEMSTSAHEISTPAIYGPRLRRRWKLTSWNRRKKVSGCEMTAYAANCSA